MGIVSRRFCLAIVVFCITSISLAQAPSQAEHDAYITAMHHKDAQAKAKALQLFLRDYPSGRLREAALESLLEAYRQTGSAKEADALDELLRINPNNLYGLTVKASSAAMNTKLSEDRAKAVVTYLMQQGEVPMRHIVAPGAMGEYGEAASNETKAGRAENRRVEVKVLVNKGIAGS